MTTEQTFASVWDAIEDTPAEAENMKVRSALLMKLNQYLEQLPGTDAEKAARLGITRPRYSDLKHGRIQKFSIDALVGYALASAPARPWHMRQERRSPRYTTNWAELPKIG